MQKLNNALQKVLKDYAYPLKSLKTAYHNISSCYQKSSSAPIKSPLDALSYAAARMPATLSVIQKVLAELPSTYSPSSVLDLGCGTGSSVFAIKNIWPESTIKCVDQNQHMLEIGKKLCEAASLNHIKFEKSKLDNVSNEPFDIVLLSYVLGELSLNLTTAVSNYWQMANDFLIIILPGTPKDFKLLLEARQTIINLGGYILAPCPSNHDCPMSNSSTDWCHFSQRLERTKMHRDIKGGTQPFEDEKFCYLIAAKKPVEKTWQSRIIKKPIPRSGHITLDLCTLNGINRETFGKKSPQFKAIKKLQWHAVI